MSVVLSRRIAGLAAAAACALAALPAAASQINTGGLTGAYAQTFCPLLEKELRDNQFDYVCTPSDGSRENILRSVGDPVQIGFSQFDTFALERERLGGKDKLLTAIRSDIGRECLFMVTKNRQLTSLGQISGAASQLKFVLPPANSGSAATFEFLQQIDPEGLGAAPEVAHVRSTDEALLKAMTDDDTVALFVQFPDPNNPRFKSIQAGGGNIVPVIDRSVLRQELAGQKVYFAEETEIAAPKWNKAASKIITACTPMVLITGTPERVEETTLRQDQEDLIRTVQALPLEALRPKEGFLKGLLNKTKALSAQSIEKMINLSEEAREKARPMMDEAMKKAKEMTEKAKQQAQDILDKARQQTPAP